MNVLHLASYGEWTGASAAALEEVLALRSAGIDASLAYTGGGSLEARCRDLPFAHAVVSNHQNPIAVIRATHALRALISAEEFDVVHSHLTHDHWLAILAGAGRASGVLVRTYHAARPLRGDPITRGMIRRTSAICVSNATLVDNPALAGRTIELTPPPIDTNRFRPDGSRQPTADSGSFRVGFIGKMAPGRGFEEVMQVFRLIAARRPEARLTLLGDGELRSSIEDLATELDLAGKIDWAGYRIDDLPSWYRGMDVLVHTAMGSEEGYRSTIEALACGTPVASWPLPGIESVLGSLSHSMISDDKTASSLAETALRGADLASMEECVASVGRFSYGPSADRLVSVYKSALVSLR